MASTAQFNGDVATILTLTGQILWYRDAVHACRPLPRSTDLKEPF